MRATSQSFALLILLLSAPSLTLGTGCGDSHDADDRAEDDTGGGAATVGAIELTFQAASGGDPLVFSSRDVDALVVIPDSSDHDHHHTEEYRLSLRFLDDAVDPVDLSSQIRAAADLHQVFFTGSAVQGPAHPDNRGAVLEQIYADQDGAGLPIGLENDIVTLELGDGELEVGLWDFATDGSKPADAVEQVANGGLETLSGELVAQARFVLVVE